MSQSSISPSVRRWLTALAAVGIAGCSTTESYELGQPIEMGPWIFEVERVQDRVSTQSDGHRQKIVTLTLRLHNYTERHERTFDDFMNGRTPGGFIPISFPKLHLVHEDGAEFLADVSSVSRGSLRSERWQAQSWLLPDNAGITNLSPSWNELWERYADAPLSDLVLVIDNPDRRSGQPRKASVRLE